MYFRSLVMAVAIGSFGLAAPSMAQSPVDWDGLVKVSSKRLNLVFLQPGADFRGYSKVLLEPTEVAFEKEWLRENRRNSGFSRISDSELERAISKGVAASSDIFAAAWRKGGYTVVTAPGPDVLRVKTGIVRISVSAPDKRTPGLTYTLTPEAGWATLFVEARDSLSGALLGRAVDQRIAGENSAVMRTSASNRAHFRDMVQTWAEASVRGMDELKSLSPIRQ